MACVQHPVGTYMCTYGCVCTAVYVCEGICVYVREMFARTSYPVVQVGMTRTPCEKATSRWEQLQTEALFPPRLH